jgi:hypothetical protein
MPFQLPCDAQGRFELCANAPATLAVWIENAATRERLSAETQLAFKNPGAQDPVTFRELQGKKVTLRFINVPAHGEVQATIRGKDSAANSISLRCNGFDFTREFTLAGDERIQLRLRTAGTAREKSGWSREIKVDLETEITIDLGGFEHSVRLESPELGELAGEGSLLFLRCDGGEASLDQTVLVLCNAGRGNTPVFVPNGRWLYRYDDKNQVATWGVVDVMSATHSVEELVLRPRLRLAPIAELQPGIRFDEIEGVSLAKLPDKFRTASAKGGSERVALPLDAKYATLEGK